MIRFLSPQIAPVYGFSSNRFGQIRESNLEKEKKYFISPLSLLFSLVSYFCMTKIFSVTIEERGDKRMEGEGER